MPDHELFEKAARGEVVLGGCMVMGEPDPRWGCPECTNPLGWGEPHPAEAGVGVEPPASGVLRVGTWNVERSPHPSSAKGEEVTLWQSYLAADIWLLTEVHEEWGYGPGPWSEMGSWAVSPPRGGALEDHRRWAGIQSRFRLDPIRAGEDDHPAAQESLCLARVHLPETSDAATVLVACSVLPWGGAGKYWQGLPDKYLNDQQAFVLSHHIARIKEAWDEKEPIIWGGDFNQELVPLSAERRKAGYRLAGTSAGIERLRAAFRTFGLRTVTERSEHLNLGAPTIDHIAVSEGFATAEPRVHRPHYADGRLLSDHAVYVADVDLQPAGVGAH
jgi:hypothetical protein